MSGSTFLGSYGAVFTMFEYLPKIEQTRLQTLNKYMYETGVGRTQIKIRLKALPVFVHLNTIYQF